MDADVEHVPVSLHDACRWFFQAMPDDEVDRVRQSIPDMTEEIRDIDQALVDMQERQIYLRKELIHAESLLAPIRKLPRELLLEVFSLAVSENHVVQTGTSPANITLASVCAAWRQMLLGLPGLWAQWELRLGPAQFAEYFQQTIFAVHFSMMLDRSEKSPLTIDVFSVAPIQQAFLDAIIGHGSHLEHLAIYSPAHLGTYAPVNEWVKRTNPQLMMLKTLDIPSMWHSAGMKAGRPSAVFSFVDMRRVPSTSLFEYLLSAPNLRNLHADMRMLHVYQTRLRFTWSQMYSLHLEQVRLTNELVIILNSTSALTSLDLTFDGVIDAVHVTQPVRLQSLHRLKLSLVHQHTEIFLSWITAPNLQHLHLYRDSIVQDHHHLTNLESAWDTRCLSVFLAQSQCALQTLNLSHLPCEDDFLAEIIQANGQRLQELDLEETGVVSDRILEWMTYDPANEQTHGVLPELEVFGVRNSGGRSAGLLGKMVESRTYLLQQLQQQQKQQQGADVPIPVSTTTTTPSRLTKIIVRDDDVDLFELYRGARVCGFRLVALAQFATEQESSPRDAWLSSHFALPPIRMIPAVTAF